MRIGYFPRVAAGKREHDDHGPGAAAPVAGFACR
ncbi:MAG: hypothetical protein QOD93_2297, partial [Acetobacteraceae bacterium]|nr:hypothetical protein [Acetobacteraceae bacterium]